MTITELIQQLESIKNEHGDLNVITNGHSDSDGMEHIWNVDIYEGFETEPQWGGSISSIQYLKHYPDKSSQKFVAIT